jgi:integrase
MPRKRRTKGEGTFVERADGTWATAFSFGINPTTKKRDRRWIYAPTEKELKRKIADIKARNGGTIKPRMPGTVGEMVERWLLDDVKPNRAPNTFRNYEDLWRLHAKRLIAGKKIEDFDVADVSAMLGDLRRDGKSNSVLQRVMTVLHRAFEVAIRRREFTRANPFALVERPTHRPAEARALTVPEAKKFLLVAKGDRYEALWILLLTAGLRLGEALALEVRDVDFAKGTITVRRSFVEVKGGVEVGPTKTKGSRRLVEVGKLALDALKKRATDAEQDVLKRAAKAELEALERRADKVVLEALKQRAANVVEEGSALLFGTTLGTEMRRSNLRRSHFEPIIERAKLGHLRIHDLRHSMTSLAIGEGIGIKILAERLGHSTTRLTNDRYAHVLPGIGRVAATAIDAVLSPKRLRSAK